MKSPVLLRWNEVKALWGICWRMTLWAPVAWFFGTLALVLVIVLSMLPPLYAVILIYGGQYLWAALSLIAWGLWLRFGRPVRQFVFEGWEHGGL